MCRSTTVKVACFQAGRVVYSATKTDRETDKKLLLKCAITSDVTKRLKYSNLSRDSLCQPTSTLYQKG